MTKSARQDTSKAVKSAGTGSAAIQGEAAPEPGETAQPAVEAATAAPPSAAAEGGSAPAEVAESDAKPDLDETKRKFREALERKNQAHSEGQGKGGRDDGKIHGAHGPAASRRNFRRKSG
jgi:Family of unknown function (DUF5302)